MERSRFLPYFFLLIFFVAGCAGKTADVIRLAGDEEAIRGFVLPVKETFEEENRGISIDIVSSPGTGLAELLRGDLDAIVSVNPLSEMMRVAAAENQAADFAKLQSIEVGKSATVVFLNTKNSVRKITRKQLRSIFSGKLTNWKQLNGANRGIVVVWNSSAETENEIFIRDVLGGVQLKTKLLVVDSFETMRKKVMETPGAIGVAPSGMIMAGLRVPDAPMTSTKVIVITKGKPTANVNKVIDILKDMEFLQ